MVKILKDRELITELNSLLWSFRPCFKQMRVFQRVVLLAIGEVLTLARHTVTQILMTLGWTQRDWKAWYQIFRKKRFPYMRLVRQLVAEYLRHVKGDWMVVVGDGTVTMRSSDKIEGVGWLPHPKTAVFRRGLLQRWFHLAWLTPAEDGYSRALPMLWLPAFTEGSHRRRYRARSEIRAALVALRWLRWVLKSMGRGELRVLMLGDGRYDQVEMWRRLPDGVVLLARSARNRCLYFLPGPGMRANRLYGERAQRPEEVWRERRGWRRVRVRVRGRERHLEVKVVGPVVRRGVSRRPLFLIVVRGKRSGRVRREPLLF